jgi:hypothetical protein
MGVIWGIPYLLIKVAYGGVSVPVLVCTRVALGYSIGPLIANRKLADLPPVAVNAVCLGTAAVSARPSPRSPGRGVCRRSRCWRSWPRSGSSAPRPRARTE